MSYIPKALLDLIDYLKRLPGIGPRTAERLGYHIFRMPVAEVRTLAKLIGQLSVNVMVCNTCFNLAESNSCGVCSDVKRDKGQIMVVEEPLDVVAIEKTRRYQGTYHVLGGVLDPLRGVGADELRVQELIMRMRDALDNDKDLEIILATNPSTEGETTALYLRNLIRESFSSPAKLKLTRIARGLPVGGDVEFADPITLSRSFEGRVDY